MAHSSVYYLYQFPTDVAIQGVHRWLNRLWRLCQQHVQACKPHSLEEHTQDATAVRRRVVSATHKAIKQVS